MFSFPEQTRPTNNFHYNSNYIKTVTFQVLFNKLTNAQEKDLISFDFQNLKKEFATYDIN